MKIIVTHNSPDWDAITSVWLIKRFLAGWEEASIQFVPAGERIGDIKYQMSNTTNNPIEKMREDEVIHVDTGLGPLDHHQTESQDVSAASLTFEFVRSAENSKLRVESLHEERVKHREEAVKRIVRVVVGIDHFKEVFWENPTADYHEFSLLGVLEGLKAEKPGDDNFYVDFGMQLLDALLHNFENRIWAEKEISEKGKTFQTRWGKGIGFLTINDLVLALSQKMGYVVVVRKDPRKGYVRIKARPQDKRLASSKVTSSSEDKKLNAKRYSLDADIDLTLAYEKLKKIDPEATWFLHVSKKILLNGTVKNPKMRPTKLGLDEIIQVLESV